MYEKFPASPPLSIHFKGWGMITGMSQEPFCVEMSRVKCRTRIQGTSFCTSLRNRNAHGHITRDILRGNLQNPLHLQ